MSTEEVTAKLGTGEDAPSFSVNFDFGDNLEGATEMYGEEVVFGRYRSAAVVDLQALIRRHAGGENGKSNDEIQGIVAEWKPGVQRARKSTKQKALDAFENLSAEEREELLGQLVA